MAWSWRVLTVVTFYILGLHTICILNTAVNCTGITPNPMTNYTPSTYSTTKGSDDKGTFSGFWSNYQVAFLFGGFLLLLGILCIVVIIRRKSTLTRQSQQRNRHCGLMTAAIVQLSGSTYSNGSGNTDIVVHPVKPPSYEEAMNETTCSQGQQGQQGQLPTYMESLRDSFKDYPKHYCQNMKY